MPDKVELVRWETGRQEGDSLAVLWVYADDGFRPWRRCLYAELQIFRRLFDGSWQLTNSFDESDLVPDGRSDQPRDLDGSRPEPT